MLKKLHIRFLQVLILGVLSIFLSASNPVQGTELVKAWDVVANCGDASLAKLANNLDELENVLRHVDKIDAAGGYKVWKASANIDVSDWATYLGKNIDELSETPAGYQFYTRNEQKFIRRKSVSDINTPQLGVKNGKVVHVVNKVISSVDEIKQFLKTDIDKAFFWSGRTSKGEGVMDMALEIARSKGGATLEGILERFKIAMPEWNNNLPDIVKLWEDVSASYANQVMGEVRVVLGRNLRPGNIWETIEMPRLKRNSNVTKIIKVDPETGIESLIWTR